MGNPGLLCLSTQPQESECSRDRILLLSRFSQYREPNHVGVQGTGRRNPRKAGQGQVSHLPSALLSTQLCFKPAGGGHHGGNLRGKQPFSPYFRKMQENNIKHKNNPHRILCTKCFTICQGLLRSLFSFEPHLGSIRTRKVITFTLHVRTVLGLSKITQLINSRVRI